MNLQIKVTGPAGLGMNSTADIVAEIFATLGYNIIGDIEYQSLIKGGINWFDINISDKTKYISKYSDIILSFNDTCLEKTLPLLRKGGYIIVNKKWEDKLLVKKPEIFSDYKVLSLEISDKYDNTYLLGVLAKLLSLDIADINTQIEQVFGRKGVDIVQKNKDIVKSIYESYKLADVGLENFLVLPEIKKIRDPQTISYGNKMIADGAIASDLGYYAAYPMTPASSVLTEVINSKKVTFLQTEDELAAMNSALGASYAGKRSMVGSSGGGFALMVEALSFAVQAEIGVTAVLSQRAGPSTGTPTFHEAGDLHFALNCIFGADAHHIILYPSSLEEAYALSGYALNLADIYQCPVIILSDKQFGEGKVNIGELQAAPVNRGKIEQNPSSDYKRYEYSGDGISPKTVPGQKDGDFIATSYEHDEYGATSEESDVKVNMTHKRAEKLLNFFEKEGISGYEVFDNPSQPSFDKGRGKEDMPQKYLIVTSFTSYTAKEFVKRKPQYGLIIVKFLKPLDHRFVDLLKQNGVEEITFVESNYSGQLEKYMCDELGLRFIDGLKISNFRKYDLYPFYMEDFEERF